MFNEDDILPISCTVVKEPEAKHINSGFFLSASNTTISWDTTFAKISALPTIKFEYDQYGSKFIVFEEPIIIGNLKIFNFKIRYPDSKYRREDVPIDNIYVYFKMQEKNGEENYYAIKNALIKVIGEPSPCWEYEGRKASHWTIEKLHLCLSFDCEGGDKEASFHIENNRDYIHLISPFSLNVEPTKVISFSNKGFYIDTQNFRKNMNLYKTPSLLEKFFTNKISSIIWLEEKSGTIGFSDDDFSLISDLNELESIHLQNVLPGKGGGGTYVFFTFNEGVHKINTSIQTELFLFDKYIDKIKDLVQDKFEVLKPTYNA